MKLLLDERNLIIAIGNSIEYGNWGNIQDMSSWKISTTRYIMDNNYSVVDIGDLEIPNYVNPNEYYFIDGKFKLADECPNEYKDRIVTVEEELTNTELALVEQYEINLALEDDLINTQLALTEQYELNIVLEDRLTALEELVQALTSNQ